VSFHTHGYNSKRHNLPKPFGYTSNRRYNPGYNTMSSGFSDFSFGSGDENLGKKNRRFKAEKDRTYRMTFCWYKDFDSEGNPVNKPENIRFTGCERIYKPGAGYFLYKGPAYNEFGTPKQTVATVVCVWPTDREGNLDVASFKNGTGWAVMPWLFDPEKYATIKNANKRFPLIEHDISPSCTDAQFQKMTFASEKDNLLLGMLRGNSPMHRDIAKKIIEQAKACGESIHREMARDLSVEEIRSLLGGGDGGPVGANASAKDVDTMLNGILGD